MRLRPDPTFYPSPRMAMAAEKEKLAYVAAFDAGAALGRPGPHLHDALATIDVDPQSASYGKILNLTEVPTFGEWFG